MYSYKKKSDRGEEQIRKQGVKRLQQDGCGGETLAQLPPHSSLCSPQRYRASVSLRSPDLSQRSPHQPCTLSCTFSVSIACLSHIIRPRIFEHKSELSPVTTHSMGVTHSCDSIGACIQSYVWKDTKF